MTAFRWAVCEKLGFVPFLHQAEWWCATDGLIVSPHPPREGVGDAVKVLVAKTDAVEGEPVLETRTIKGQDYYVVRRQTLPRPGGRARVSADLGSFKIGKSVSAAIWGAGFAIVPNARVKLIGIEYDTCTPEFEQLLEAICSDRGMGMAYDSLQNRPKDGRMWLELSNGARFEARSWERKDGLKGKEDDAYIYAEAFQLPGIECFTDFKQNLDKREGYAVFPTTPDRPWVEIFHQLGHGDPEFPTWQCTCGVQRSVNPYSFDATQMQRDRKLMTREKFGIHYEGKIGRYVGSVYNYQRGQRQFDTRTHPHLWANPEGPATWENLKLPRHWEVLGAGDSGTFTSAVLVAFDERGDAFVIYEQPNYRYIGGKHEFDDSTIPEWAGSIGRAMGRCGVHGLFADRNSQFKREFQNYDITLYGANAGLELRTKIAREYFHGDAIHLAPWLDVLPYELEQAQWPEETTAGGRFQRLKKQDHSLDGLEHVLARRPRSVTEQDHQVGTWIEEYIGRPMHSLRNLADPHLGVQ